MCMHRQGSVTLKQSHHAQVVMADEEDEQPAEPSTAQPSQQPASRSAQGAPTSTAADVFRIRPNAALGAALPTFVKPEGQGQGQGSSAGPLQQRQPPPAHRKKAASKAKAQQARFPRVQHDDPLVTLDAGTLAI